MTLLNTKPLLVVGVDCLRWNPEKRTGLLGSWAAVLTAILVVWDYFAVLALPARPRQNWDMLIVSPYVTCAHRVWWQPCLGSLCVWLLLHCRFGLPYDTNTESRVLSAKTSWRPAAVSAAPIVRWPMRSNTARTTPTSPSSTCNNLPRPLMSRVREIVRWWETC